MIKSFTDKKTEQIFSRAFAKGFSKELCHLALRKLLLVDAAVSLDDLRVPPGNRLEKLTGDRQGQYSIRINKQWRICFEWAEGDAYEVEIVDYH